MASESAQADNSLLQALVHAAKHHYKLVGSIGALLGALLVIYYCGSISYYPSGLSLADTLFFMWVIVVFGFYYSVLAFGFFLAAMFWVALLAKPLNWALNKTPAKFDLFVPYPSNDRLMVFFGGIVANGLVVLMSLLASHSLTSIVGTLVLIGFGYTLLDNVTKKPWRNGGLVDTTGKRFFEPAISLNTAKIVLFGMIYVVPLLFGQVGDGLARTTFETMGVRAADVEVVIDAKNYKPTLVSLHREKLVSEIDCNDDTCSIGGATVLFTGVGSGTKLQVRGEGGNVALVIPNSAIKLVAKRVPKNTLQRDV